MKSKIFLLISTLFFIIICFVLYFNIAKKDETNLQTVKLAEVTHSSFYTPLYVAIEKGYFKEEGLDIELILTPGADKVSAAVLSHDADIGLAGAESAIYVYQENKDNYLQIFSGLTKRDGQFIVSRKENNDFKLTDLYGKEILVGRSTGMPALNFLNALKKNNVDINKININYSIDFASLSGAFIGNTGDYVNLFDPNATNLEKEGYGHIVASVGALSSEVPYTTFYALKNYITNNKDIITKFTNAINKGINYTLTNNEEIVAKDIINQFPNTNIDDLTEMIKRYKEYDCWLNNPYVSEKLFTNLEDFLIDFDLLKEKVPYNELVNNFYNE